MFAIYDNNGINFRDSLDELYDHVKTLNQTNEVYNRLEPSLEHKVAYEEKQERSQTDVAEHAADAYKQMAKLHDETEIYHVNQIMTHPAVSITSTTKLIEAWELMDKYNIEQLPVINERDMINGMVSYKDMLKVMLEDPDHATRSLQREIDTLLNQFVITTDPVSDIRRVARVMMDYSLGAIPVVNENHVLVGIVTKSDIVKAFSKEPHLRIWS